MNYVEKILDISSLPIKDTVNHEIQNIDIANILNRKNGFFAFENALHFFSDEEIFNINKLVKNYLSYDKDCLFFAEDLFGNLFCEKKGKYYLLGIESGELEFIANDLNEWSKSILNDYDYLTGYSLAHKWQSKNGPLKSNERLVPKRFFILGGQYSIDNLYPMDHIKALTLRENIFKKVFDIQDGEKMIIDCPVQPSTTSKP